VNVKRSQEEDAQEQVKKHIKINYKERNKMYNIEYKEM